MSGAVEVPKPLLEQITEDMLKNLSDSDLFNVDLLEKLSRLIQLGHLSSEEHLTTFMKLGVETIENTESQDQ